MQPTARDPRITRAIFASRHPECCERTTHGVESAPARQMTSPVPLATKELVPHRRTPRVASLLPSATEIVCALGMERALVGVSHECDHPASVRGIRVLTSTKVLPGRASGEIDRDVRAVLRDALGVYDIDVAALKEMRPDVVVTQDLCDVCAVSLDQVERAIVEVLHPSVRLVNLRPTRLSGILDAVRQVARALDCEARGEEVTRAMRARIEAVRRRSMKRAATPNVLTIEWLDPVMIGATWMPELVTTAGGRALVTLPGEHAPTVSLETLARLHPAPDVVLVKPCGFDLQRTRGELDLLRALLDETDWPAVRSGAVWIADGNAYFNRPGPRIVESLEILAACLHPELYPDFAERHRLSYERVPMAARVGNRASRD